jgi:dihydroxyacetone kinase DhaKLM complex PTS-EIIA-like component DhaM
MVDEFQVVLELRGTKRDHCLVANNAKTLIFCDLGASNLDDLQLVLSAINEHILVKELCKIQTGGGDITQTRF